MEQPFELDYFQVLFTTCDLLAQVYHQINLFIDPTGNHSSPNASSVNLGIPSNSHSLLSNGGNGFSPSLIELVLKIDTRIKVSLSISSVQGDDTRTDAALCALTEDYRDHH